MSTILESVNTLSEKLGVTEREQTIKDQLDLCVERLGGEGNSKDIAESAEKFAEKEDGTATFMTKTITENNTYNAADDGVSGYSSVTVNVESSDLASSYICYGGEKYGPTPSDPSTLDNIKNKLMLINVPNGVANINTVTESVVYGTVILNGDISKINVTAYQYSFCVTFKAAENFEGFIIEGSEVTPTGATISAGNWYNALVQSTGVSVETNSELGIVSIV